MILESTEDQRAIQEAARAFAAAELAPNSARWDEEAHFPVDVERLGLGAKDFSVALQVLRGELDSLKGAQ